MKQKIIIQIIIWSTVATFLMGVLIYAAVSNQVGSEVGSFNSAQSVKEYNVATKGIETIDIDITSKNLDIYETEDDKILVKYYASRSNRDEMKIEVKDKTLSIEEDTKIKFLSLFNFFGLGSGNERVEVYIPQNYKENLDIKTTSSDIYLEEYRGKQASIKSVSGDLVIQKLEVKTLDLETTSGEIEIKELVSQELYGKTTSGNVEIQEAAIEEVRLSSVSGEIEIELEKDCRNIELNTTSGNMDAKIQEGVEKMILDTVSGTMEIELPQSVGFEADFKTVSGDLSNEWDAPITGEKSQKYCKYEDGSMSIKAKSVSGDLKLGKN